MIAMGKYLLIILSLLSMPNSMDFKNGHNCYDEFGKKHGYWLETENSLRSELYYYHGYRQGPVKFIDNRTNKPIAVGMYIDYSSEFGGDLYRMIDWYMIDSDGFLFECIHSERPPRFKGNRFVKRKKDYVVAYTDYGGAAANADVIFDAERDIIFLQGYRNNTISTKRTFNRFDTNGLKHGRWKDESDSVVCHCYYLHGRKQGPAIIYDHDSGVILQYGIYEDDSPSGIWYTYNKMGYIQSVCSYRSSVEEYIFDNGGRVIGMIEDNVLHSFDEPYYYSILNAYRDVYINGYNCSYDWKGRREGKWLFFSGAFEYVYTYKNGERNGLFTQQNCRSKVIQCLGEYSNNDLSGDWFSYDDQGILLEERRNIKLIKKRLFSKNEYKYEAYVKIYSRDGTIIKEGYALFNDDWEVEDDYFIDKEREKEKVRPEPSSLRGMISSPSGKIRMDRFRTRQSGRSSERRSGHHQG